MLFHGQQDDGGIGNCLTPPPVVSQVGVPFWAGRVSVPQGLRRYHQTIRGLGAVGLRRPSFNPEWGPSHSVEEVRGLRRYSRQGRRWGSQPHVQAEVVSGSLEPVQ